MFLTPHRMSLFGQRGPGRSLDHAHMIGRFMMAFPAPLEFLGKTHQRLLLKVVGRAG